jgi:hypothetical protein
MAGSGAVSRPPHGALESILRCCITTEEIMQKNGWLIGWVCFVGFVTWLDWWGAIPYIFVSFGVGFSRIMFFLIPILLLVALRVVLHSADIARLQRTVLVLGILGLLILPFIPWKAEKALIIEYLVLVPGMPRTLVHSIMTAHPGIHDPGERGGVFYAEGDLSGTFVITHIVGDVLESAEIELD